MPEEYTPMNRERVLAQAGQELGAELGKDAAVAQAKTAYEQAQQALAAAQDRKNALPYPGHASRHQLSQWHQAVDEVSRAKVAVLDAEKAFRAAQNDAAAKIYAARLQSERNAQAERRNTEQAQRQMLEEEVARGAAEQHWLNAGGKKADFDKAWPGMWIEELKRRTLAAEEQTRRLSAARNAF